MASAPQYLALCPPLTAFNTTHFTPSQPILPLLTLSFLDFALDRPVSFYKPWWIRAYDYTP